MARRRLSIRQKLRKRLNKALESSFGSQFVILIILTVFMLGVGILVAYFVLARLGLESGNLKDVNEAFWWTWERITGGGLADDKGGGPLRVLFASIIVFFGWIVFGLLVSILATAFQERLEKIRHGTMEVLAADHTILLGWNSTVFSVIDQLGSDDEGLAGETVVLSDLEVDTMKEEAAKYCRPGSLRKTEFRRGSIASVKNIQDLKIADALQVIILGSDAPPGGEDDAAMQDASVLKALLACYQAMSAEGGVGDRRLPIVASVKSAETAELIERGVPKSVAESLVVHVVHTADLLSRLTAQSANQPALALVYKELFSYEGSIVDGVDISSEIYCVPIDKAMLGLTFADCLLGFDDAVPIGYATGKTTAVNPKPGTPEAEHALQKGDRIIVVADNREDVRWTGGKALPKQEFTPRDLKPAPKNVLVMGEGVKPRKVLEHLPGFLPPGSRIAASQSTEGLDPGASSFHRFTRPGALTGAESAEEPRVPSDEPAGAPRLVEFDSIVLADDIPDPDRHDAKMLMDLTGIYASLAGSKLRASIIVELLDYRNLDLARAFGEMAAIISSELVSNFLVQLAVDPDRGAVFTELLDPAGNEIYVRPVERFLAPGEEELSFIDIFTRARALGEIAIGYIPPSPEPLRLCPHDRDVRKKPAEYGKVVVVAED